VVEISKDSISPVIEGMSQDGRGAAMLSSPDGEILIAHERPIEGVIQWIEYDVARNSFMIIHEGGRVQDLGLKINEVMQDNISNGRKVMLVHMVGGEIQSGQRALLVVRDY
jgi:hypothetical protein